MQSVYVVAVYTVCMLMYCRAGPVYKTDVKHLNCKLCYRQLHLKYWCNLARY